MAVKFDKNQMHNPVIEMVKEVLLQRQIVPIVFIEQYHFSMSEEREMMNKAMEEIDRCDLLIAETSVKGIGIGIEAGYAKGKNIPVIYLRHKGASHSSTLSGLSDYQIIYSDENDLSLKLNSTLECLLGKF